MVLIFKILQAILKFKIIYSQSSCKCLDSLVPQVSTAWLLLTRVGSPGKHEDFASFCWVVDSKVLVLWVLYSWIYWKSFLTWPFRCRGELFFKRLKIRNRILQDPKFPNGFTYAALGQLWPTRAKAPWTWQSALAARVTPKAVALSHAAA